MATCYIADDDQLIRMVYADIFVERGYAVETFENGRELVDACRRRMPDVIIVDVSMPMLNGLDACRMIRLLPGGRNVMVIINSGDSEVVKTGNFRGCGNSRFFCKPIHSRCLGVIAEVVML